MEEERAAAAAAGKGGSRAGPTEGVADLWCVCMGREPIWRDTMCIR